MATPCQFPEQNVVLVGSPEDRAAGNVLDLPAHRYRDLDGCTRIITKWRLSLKELEEVRRTGVIWIEAWGYSQPPIAVIGQEPFIRSEKDGKTGPELP